MTNKPFTTNAGTESNVINSNPRKQSLRRQSDEPSANWQGGRGPYGRFAMGNSGGPGNQLAGPRARLRSALLSAISHDDIRAIVKAFVTKAKASGMTIREMLDRCLGRPVPGNVIDGDEYADVIVATARDRVGSEGAVTPVGGIGGKKSIDDGA